MSEEEKPLEGVVLGVVGQYLRRKLDTKYGIEWEKAKATDAGKREYEDKKAKLAREAFLGVRARTGADFVEYFVATLCSVPQFLPESTFLSLSKQLYADTERIRTLTLLALSAKS